jgi:hypothetical protein
MVWGKEEGIREAVALVFKLDQHVPSKNGTN